MNPIISTVNPHSWETAPLGHHAEVKARIGWRGLSSTEYTKDGPFLIAGQHIINGSIQWDLCDHISEFRYQESREIALKEGDVILTKDGTIGRVARIDQLPGSATLNGTMMLVRPKRALEYRYLYHSLSGHSFKKLIKDKVSGSSIPHIFQRDIVGLKILLPPIEEQARIAHILDTLDESIQTTQFGIIKLEQSRIGLIRDLLRFGVDERGDLRPSGRVGFKKSPLGLIPMSWEVAPFDRYESSERPVIKTGPFGSTLKGTDWVIEGVPVITIGALGEGEVDPAQLLFVTEEKARRLAAYAVREGDLLFSRVADVGRSIVVTSRESGWIMSSNLMWISLDQAQVDPHFAWLSLTKNTIVRSQVRRSLNAGGREVANGPILRSLLIAWPSLDEQQRIVALERTAREKIQAEKTQLVKLEILKSGLSSDLLTGRVRTRPQ